MLALQLPAWQTSLLPTFKAKKETRLAEPDLLAGGRLVTIHPFSVGNGRTSRLLMNFVLELLHLPFCILYKEDKALYYEALQKGQQQGDQKPFFDFMYRQYEKQLQEEITRAEGLNLTEPKKERSF